MPRSGTLEEPRAMDAAEIDALPAVQYAFTLTFHNWSRYRCFAMSRLARMLTTPPDVWEKRKSLTEEASSMFEYGFLKTRDPAATDVESSLRNGVDCSSCVSGTAGSFNGAFP